MDLAVRRDARVVEPAVIVEIGLDLSRIRRLSVERRSQITAAELVAIQHRSAVAIEDR